MNNITTKLPGCFVFDLEKLDLEWALADKKNIKMEKNKNSDKNRSNQKEELLDLIIDFSVEYHKTKFTRQEFLNAHLEDLKKLWPKTKTPEQTFSRLMQELRDDGWIKFLDKKGEYEIL